VAVVPRSYTSGSIVVAVKIYSFIQSRVCVAIGEAAHLLDIPTCCSTNTRYSLISATSSGSPIPCKVWQL